MVNNKDTYSNWLSNPNELDVKETDSLKELINLYPFCSTSRVLYLKGLQNTNSIHYNQVLKETAAYASYGNSQRLGVGASGASSQISLAAHICRYLDIKRTLQLVILTHEFFGFQSPEPVASPYHD